MAFITRVITGIDDEEYVINKGKIMKVIKCEYISSGCEYTLENKEVIHIPHFNF